MASGSLLSSDNLTESLVANRDRKIWYKRNFPEIISSLSLNFDGIRHYLVSGCVMFRKSNTTGINKTSGTVSRRGNREAPWNLRSSAGAKQRRLAVTKYQCTTRKIPGEWRPHLHCGGRLKSRKALENTKFFYMTTQKFAWVPDSSSSIITYIYIL